MIHSNACSFINRFNNLIAQDWKRMLRDVSFKRINFSKDFTVHMEIKYKKCQYKPQINVESGRKQGIFYIANQFEAWLFNGRITILSKLYMKLVLLCFGNKSTLAKAAQGPCSCWLKTISKCWKETISVMYQADIVKEVTGCMWSK